jgi:hypothetical protein
MHAADMYDYAAEKYVWTQVAVAKGEAKEAARLEGFTSNAAAAARAEVTKYQLEILREGGVAQVF